jgi:acyl carrier protein
MDASDFRTFVLNFLSSARPDLASRVMAIPDDMDLFEAGAVDSHTFIGLCLAIEERTGHPIDIAELDPEEFSSIDGLRRVARIS